MKTETDKTMGNSCANRDLVKGKSYWLLWGLPTAVVLLGILAAPALRVWLWTPAFLVMGISCSVNARRCGRLHCYVTGPLGLIAALASVGTGLGLSPIPWSWIGFGALGGMVVAHIPELIVAKYVART